MFGNNEWWIGPFPNKSGFSTASHCLHPANGAGFDMIIPESFSPVITSGHKLYINSDGPFLLILFTMLVNVLHCFVSI